MINEAIFFFNAQTKLLNSLHTLIFHRNVFHVSVLNYFKWRYFHTITCNIHPLSSINYIFITVCSPFRDFLKHIKVNKMFTSSKMMYLSSVLTNLEGPVTINPNISGVLVSIGLPAGGTL